MLNEVEDHRNAHVDLRVYLEESVLHLPRISIKYSLHGCAAVGLRKFIAYFSKVVVPSEHIHLRMRGIYQCKVLKCGTEQNQFFSFILRKVVWYAAHVVMWAEVTTEMITAPCFFDVYDWRKLSGAVPLASSII